MTGVNFSPSQSCKLPQMGAAQRVRFFHYSIEHWSEFAGRRIDELQYLGDDSAPSGVPALIAAAGERASMRFLESLAANIRNPHTRRPYYRAAEEFLAWCASACVSSIAALRPVHVATWIEASTRELAAPLTAYLDGAGLRRDPNGPLFRTIGRGTGQLTRTVLPQANAYAMIGWRAAAAGIETKLGNYRFRATGITAYLRTAARWKKPPRWRTTPQLARRSSTIARGTK